MNADLAQLGKFLLNYIYCTNVRFIEFLYIPLHSQGVKDTFFCFKQLSLNDKLELESPYQLTDGERLLPVVVEVVISLGDRPLDLHDTTLCVSPRLFKA